MLFAAFRQTLALQVLPSVTNAIYCKILSVTRKFARATAAKNRCRSASNLRVPGNGCKGKREIPVPVQSAIELKNVKMRRIQQRGKAPAIYIRKYSVLVQYCMGCTAWVVWFVHPALLEDNTVNLLGHLHKVKIKVLYLYLYSLYLYEYNISSNQFSACT